MHAAGDLQSFLDDFLFRHRNRLPHLCSFLFLFAPVLGRQVESHYLPYRHLLQIAFFLFFLHNFLWVVFSKVWRVKQRRWNRNLQKWRKNAKKQNKTWMKQRSCVFILCFTCVTCMRNMDLWDEQQSWVCTLLLSNARLQSCCRTTELFVKPKK